MVFNSFVFAIFFTSVCVIMLATNANCVKKYLGANILNFRHNVLLIASYIFYGWWDWRFALLMLGLSFIAYICALQLSKTKKRVYLYIGVIIPLVTLGVFKYFNFFVTSFVDAFGIQNSTSLNIILPVGISFYTFQSLSYTIDVYRQKLAPEKDFVKVALYVAFFPQLVAGPIVKADSFIPQLYEDRNINWHDFEVGIQYFAFGLFKKIVLADNISVCVDAVFNNPYQYHAISIIFAVIAYSIQIYCDFSGYSDMAIGCAKCLGYDLIRNFNMPYISPNVTVFWKRWHISLSTWLQEYLYISLGGNRKGIVRTYINLFVTMLLGGLWHGAAWTFVVWGALHGGALCIHKLWMKILKRDKYYKGTVVGTICSTVATYVFVLLCWVFFRASDFENAKNIIMGIITWQDGIKYISSWTVLGIVCVVGCTVIACIRSKIRKEEFNGFYPIVPLDKVWGMTVIFVFVGITFALAYIGTSPFIYFQF